jgi:acyl-coenzyme A synthetase/AMP-(fatty) acid ligase
MPSQSYKAVRNSFTWQIPEFFNFGVDVVDRWAKEADGPALIWENHAGESAVYRFSDIARLTDRLAGALRARGITRGDRVIILLPRIPAWPISMVAVLKIGAVPIPCVEMLTVDDLAFRIENSGARGVICCAPQVPKLAGIAGHLPARLAVGGAPGWDDFDRTIEDADDQFQAATVAANEPAVMYYTSGSTGHPKGVVHAARALYAWRGSAKFWLDLSPADRIWCTADTGWSKAGTSILFGPWSLGASAFLFDGRFVPAERLKLLAKHRITVYCAPATEFFRVLDEKLDEFDLRALRRTVSAGEAVNPGLAERWERATGLKIAEAYGQTETLMLAINMVGEPIKYGSMGLSAPGCDVDIVDVCGSRCADGQEGVIALRLPNPQLMLGYWKDEERTNACILKGPEGPWHLTGDRGRRDVDGYLWFTGRDDDLINSAGYRIGPMEVEDVLLKHPAVQECAVVGVPDIERGEIVKAFVVLRASHVGSVPLAMELQAHAKALTAPYKYPRQIEFVDELPRTPNGKIQRRALRNRSVPAIGQESGAAPLAADGKKQSSIEERP